MKWYIWREQDDSLKGIIIEANDSQSAVEKWAEGNSYVGDVFCMTLDNWNHYYISIFLGVMGIYKTAGVEKFTVSLDK